MPERLRVFVNPTADESARLSAGNLARLADTESEIMRYPLPITPEDHTVVIYGGDGSVLSAVEEMVKQSERSDRRIIIAPSGSFNGTSEALSELHAEVTPQDIVRGNFEKTKAIRMGQIGDQPFHHGASWGKMGVSQVIGTERVRGYVPKRMRAYIGSLIAAFKHPSQLFKENVVSIAFTSPFFGRVKIVPDQDFESDQIAMATVKGGRGILPRLSSILYSFIVERRIPKHLLDIKIAKSHTIFLPENEETIVVDAELRTLRRNGEVVIQRSEAPIYMAVLTEKASR